MCGRYANFLTEQELADAFSLAVVSDDVRLLPPSWNVAPTQLTPMVLLDQGTQRVAELARWGLVPSWAKDPSIGARMINARSETVADKPSFRSAFAKRRCLIPANGYYEWHTAGGVKTPHYIHTADGSPLAFAGLFERRQDVVTCTILTTAARGSMNDLHDRQPVMLDHEQRDAWLSADSAPAALFDAIEAPAPALEWHPVGKSVGNVRHNSPALVEPAS